MHLELCTIQHQSQKFSEKSRRSRLVHYYSTIYFSIHTTIFSFPPSHHTFSSKQSQAIYFTYARYNTPLPSLLRRPVQAVHTVRLPVAYCQQGYSGAEEQCPWSAQRMVAVMARVVEERVEVLVLWGGHTRLRLLPFWSGGV
jgi:hypothetical protein